MFDFHPPQKLKIPITNINYLKKTNKTKVRNSGGTEPSHTPMIRNSESNDEVETELRRSKRIRVAKGYGPDYAAYTIEEDPTNLQEALLTMDADLWQEAISDEMDYLESSRT
jgi:hypothetical protein